MSDEEKKDILFQIDMQLYDEFNDKFCEMNDNLGTFYTYKDIEDLEKLEKETEIKLLREAIEKQQKEIESLKEKIKNFTIEDEKIFLQFGEITEKKRWKDKIKAKIEEVDKDENASITDFIEYAKEYATQKLQSLLEKE